MNKVTRGVFLVTLALLACASMALAQMQLPIGGPGTSVPFVGTYGTAKDVPEGTDGVLLNFMEEGSVTDGLYAVSAVTNPPMGISMVQWNPGSFAVNQPESGPPNWQFSSAFWKFHLNNPSSFAGKYLIVNFTYDVARSGQKRGYIGIGSTAPTHEDPSWWGSGADVPAKNVIWTPDTKVDVWGDYPGVGNTTGSGSAEGRTEYLPIPSGQADLYLGIVCGGSTSDVITVHSISIGSMSPVAEKGFHPNTINLTANQDYLNSFATKEDLHNSVYCVGGITNGPSYVTWLGESNVQLCDWNWQSSSVYWKIHTADPAGFAEGSVAKLKFNYVSAQTGRLRGFVGMGTTAPSIYYYNYSITWTPEFQEDVWGDAPGLSGYGGLDRTVEAPLPVGVQDAYFGFSGGWFGYSDVLYINSLKIDQIPLEIIPLDYGTYNNMIDITSTDYSNTFPTRDSLVNSVYAVGGAANTNNVSVVKWNGAGSVQITEPNWQFGNIFWHFHTDSPGGFVVGSTASVNFNYNWVNAGDVRAILGMSTVAPVITSTYYGSTSWAPPVSENVWGTYPGTGNVDRTMSLPLPVGAQDAYFGFLSNASNSDTITIKSVSAEIPPVNFRNGGYGNTINVGPTGTWSTNFPTPTQTLGETYAVGGSGNDAYYGPVYWNGPGNLQLADYNWTTGSMFWHFHTDNAAGFAGSTVSVNLDYVSAQSGRVRGYFGADASAPVPNAGGWAWGWSTWNPAARETVWGDYPGGDGYCSLNRTVTLALPAGQDAYFGFSGGYIGGACDVLYLRSITLSPLVSIDNIKDAKAAADGASVNISSALVSAVFPDYFYIQAEGRAHGIRVNKVSNGLTIPTRANVVGTVATVNGERCINASSVTAVSSTDGALALGMTNKALGGGDFAYVAGPPIKGQKGVEGGVGSNNIGLLVRCWGRVTNIPGVTTSFYITDGSGDPVLVDLSSGSAPTGGSAVVTGASSCGYYDGKLLHVIRSKATMIQ